MPLELYKTGKKTRHYREVLPDGSVRGHVKSCVKPLHYESVPDSGDFDRPVKMDVERVKTAELDGYLMTESAFHYSLQTVDPAESSVQPNTQKPAGTVGFGGRRGEHWFYFRLKNVGYIHWPERKLTDLGGYPDYSGEPTMSTQSINLARHPELDDEVVTSGTTIRWNGIWNGEDGARLDIKWGLSGYKMKEDIIVNQAARDWIERHPPKTPADETYFGFCFELDSTDIPKAYRNEIQQNLKEDDFDDGDGITLTDNADRLLAFMPLDEVYVANRGSRRPLRKRFYRRKGKNYLYVGVNVEHMAELLPGDLIFDPSMTQEQIAASADDCQQYGVAAADITRAYNSIGEYTYPRRSGFRFTPDVPFEASFTGGGSEYATLRLYRDAYGLYGTPLINFYGDVASANQPAFAANSVDSPEPGSNWTDSTATTAVEFNVNPASAGDQYQDVDVAAIMEEIVALVGWTPNNGLRIRADDSGVTAESLFVESYDGTPGSAAVLDAFYTTGAAPTPNRLTLLGVG